MHNIQKVKTAKRYNIYKKHINSQSVFSKQYT